MNDFLSGIFAAVLAIFSPASGPAGYAGYLEADPVYVAPVSAGRITEIAIDEGQGVSAGEHLFALDATQQQALLEAAEAQVEAAQATFDNLTTGSRSEELDVIRATLAKAEADLNLAQSNLDRSEQLEQTGTVAAVKVEQDRNTLTSAQAQVDQLRAQLAVAELPARGAQQVAAEANLQAAQANARRARLDLADRQISSPIAGTVEKVYYRVGEVAAVGNPVISILPAGALEARFFVPEAERSGLALGQSVTVSCDGCTAPLSASITHIASEPQTTPPVIYSREERSRLVYLVEATLDAAGVLQPGQPVTVSP